MDGDAVSRLMEPETAAEVRRLLEPSIRGRSLELVLVEFKRDQGQWVLRLFIGPGAQESAAAFGAGPQDALAVLDSQGGADPPVEPSPPVRQGGVTLADCKSVSKEASALLDVADPIPQHYVLEVSSPGIERPLVKPQDFVRFSGRLAKVRTGRAQDGRQNFTGMLQGLQEDDVVIVEADGPKRIPYAQIKRAHLVYEF